MTVNVKTHLKAVYGLGAETACGRSMHGWSRNCPKSVTETAREVTCLSCLKVMENYR